jgi:hypothetical protein
MAETVISAYNAARGIKDSQGQGSRSSDPDDLMKGRTFIPRMSEASRQLLIEALQKAKKKRQERLAKKKADQIVGTGYGSVEEMNKADRAKFKEGRSEMRQDRIDARKEDKVIEEDDRNLQQAKIKNQQPPISLPTNSREFETMDLNANGGKIPKFKRRTLKFR